MTIKSYPILIMIITLIFLSSISSVKANFENPSFETGDITGWTYWESYTGCNYDMSTTIIHEGSYSVRLIANWDGGVDGAGIYQYLDLTDADEISGWFYCTSTSAGTAKFLIDGVKVYLQPDWALPLNTWAYRTIDVSGYTGIKKVEIRIETPGGWRHLYIDALQTDGVGWEEASTINFIPDVDETNDSTRPEFNFTINNNDWNEYYELRIRQWRYTMVNDEWAEPPYIEWWVVSTDPFYSVNYQSYLTSFPVTQNETDIFETWPYNFYPIPGGIHIMKFKVTLHGADIYGNEVLLNSDTMIYDSNYTYTPPPIEIPTAIPTAEPTPTPTYTPFPTITPTPIPTPDPEDEGITNYTINKTGMGVFYDGVNGTIENLNGSINGVTDFFLIPTNGMTNYIHTVNSTFTNNTNQSIGHKNILSEVMIPFIYHFPLKIQLLISYYLTLLLILIILER